MFWGFSATLLLPSYFPIQSLKANIFCIVQLCCVPSIPDRQGLSALSACDVDLLVEGFQSVGVCDNSSLAEDVPKIGDVAVCDCCVLIAP